MAVSSPRGIWVGAIWTKSIILPINDIANSLRVFVISIRIESYSWITAGSCNAGHRSDVNITGEDRFFETENVKI